MGQGQRTLNDMNPAAKAVGLGTRLLRLINLARVQHTQAAGICVTSPGLAIGSGSKKKVLITNTFLFWDSASTLPKKKTTAEIDFTATDHDVVANASAARERWYLLSIVAAGTVTITAGVQGAVGAGTFPATPSGGTPIGAVRLEVAAGATDFDATTDELDEAHITDEYYNFVGVANPLDLSTIPAALSTG